VYKTGALEFLAVHNGESFTIDSNLSHDSLPGDTFELVVPNNQSLSWVRMFENDIEVIKLNPL